MSTKGRSTDKGTKEQYPYSDMHQVVSRRFERTRWLYLTLAILLAITAAFVGLVQADLDKFTPLDVVASVIMYGMIGFASLPLVLLIGYNLSPSDNEDRRVADAVDYLTQKAYSSAIVQSIEKRANVAHSAGGIRTLLPVLILSLTWSLLFSEEKIPATLLMNLGLIVLLVTLAFTLEINRANTDAIIVQACIEYYAKT